VVEMTDVSESDSFTGSETSEFSGDKAPKTLTLTHAQVKDLSKAQTLTDVVKLISDVKWNTRKITEKASIDQIEADLEFPWDPEALRDKTMRSPLILRAFPGVKWKWEAITKKIKIDSLLCNMDLPWKTSKLLKRKEEILKFLEKNKKNEDGEVENAEIVRDLKEKHGFEFGDDFGHEWGVRALGVIGYLKTLSGTEEKLDPYQFAMWHKNYCTDKRVDTDYESDYDSDDSDLDVSVPRCECRKKNPLYLVESFPHLPWEMKMLTKEASWWYIVDNPHLPWVIEDFGCYMIETRQAVRVHRAFPDVKLNWAERTKGAPSQDIVCNPDIPWDMNALVQKRFSVCLYRAYPNLPWDMEKATKDVTWNEILDNPDIPWILPKGVVELYPQDFLRRPYSSLWVYKNIRIKDCEHMTVHSRDVKALLESTSQHYSNDVVRVMLGFVL